MRRGSSLPSFQDLTPLYEQFNRANLDVTIILFWSVSCEQCVRAFEVVRQIKERYGQVNVLTIHMPRGEDDKNIQEIKRKYKQQRLQAPLYVDQDLILSKRFGTHVVPTIYVFDSSGLRYSQAGHGNLYFMMQRIEKILG